MACPALQIHEITKDSALTESKNVLPRSTISAGLATIDNDGKVLDVWYPRPELVDAGIPNEISLLSPSDAEHMLGAAIAQMAGEDPIRGVQRIAVKAAIGDLGQPVANLHDAYLRLHLLSHRLVRPNTINLDGLFEIIDHGVAWTSQGPCRASQLSEIMSRAQVAGRALHVRSTFPFPPMLDYVQPSGVTIADSMRVLLGAHLAPGTMVTPEGLCGINAGTLGPCIVEGRINAGVVIGAGSDIGGGSSLMGTLSGGGRETVSLGERCLLGANAGLGVALGDDCIVEAGCYITAGAPVRMPDGRIVKARELSGRSGLIFRRNAQTGALEAVENTGRWNGLNPLLHKP
ncbi:MAG: DapH/DapD/GlmU-related protein [Caulobacteraceae bacterium]